jgi:RHS repeat-associated protein
LKQATAGSDTVSFTYDADGMMVRRNENGQQTVYLGKLYQHNLQTGIATRHYAFGGKLVALREGANNVNFLLTDHLGSVTTTLFADGTVRANLRYDPWGKQRWASQTTPTRYRFTAQRFDDKLGLYDYNARYYDANIGRFISADVIVPGTSRLTPLTVGFHETMFIEQANGENAQLMQLGPVFRWSARQKQELGTADGSSSPQNLNRFAYSLGNPLVNTDPDGHLPVLAVPIIAGALIGATISTVAYVTVAKATGQEITIAGVAGAVAGGAVAGAVSVVATPVAGTLLGFVGVKATGTALVVGTAAVNAAGGTGSYLAGGYTQNVVDTALGNTPSFQPTVGGAAFNAGIAGGLSPAVGYLRPVSNHTMSTLNQASYFMPGRTVGTLFATQNSRNLYSQAAVATGVGAFAANQYEVRNVIQ